MAQVELYLYHTQAYTQPDATFPSLAEGYEMWLGDGYYFWQDEYFAKWWGQNKKVRGKYGGRYTIYSATLTFDEDEFIDTVFNEEDYYQLCIKIDQFAMKCKENLGRKPTLIDFNRFIEDYNLWKSIKVIRFQDIPENDDHVEVLSFYYRKRIQVRVNDPKIITNFAVYKHLAVY